MGTEVATATSDEIQLQSVAKFFAKQHDEQLED
jgi:hypothetical protein